MVSRGSGKVTFGNRLSDREPIDAIQSALQYISGRFGGRSKFDPAVADAPAARPYELPSGHFGFLVYNLLRIGLLLVVGGIVYLFGFRSYLLVLVAVFISGIISMVLLNRRRDAAVISLGEVFRRVNDRMDSRTRAEDE